MAEFKVGDEVELNTGASTEAFTSIGLKENTKYIVGKVVGKTRVILEGHEPHQIHKKWLVFAEAE